LNATIVYTITNPVTAGLVSDHAEWPGVLLYRPGRITVERPEGYFSDSGPTPERATLEIVAAPIGVPDDEVVPVIEREVARREAKTRDAMRKAGRAFLGAAAVLAQRPTDRPRTREPRRTLSPLVACRNKWARIEALQRCKQFVADYRAALARWCAGVRAAVFPAGTYLMARRFAVAVADT